MALVSRFSAVVDVFELFDQQHALEAKNNSRQKTQPLRLTTGDRCDMAIDT
jgi:hypothetical protein